MTLKGIDTLRFAKANKVYRVTERRIKQSTVIYDADSPQSACTHAGWYVENCFIELLKCENPAPEPERVSTPDMFDGERVIIEDNKPLAHAANLILEEVHRDSTLLDGDSVGEIDRKIRAAVWLYHGLREILHKEWHEDREDAFLEWAKDPKRCIDTELLRRARQWLVEKDKIRVSAAAIKDSEETRKRLTGAFRK